uniref:Glycosyltransferase family 17 n=1 Tax=Neobodo designis TaxID=312471 RepID=A0A7S1QP28_NEODS|mmetsp:Transcript_49529/g.152851  ORF Transcript_49529/g.152851 Transcript_49529/m.152851 type:complete len:482 (+) Transcript_49529:72-1517(+)
MGIIQRLGAGAGSFMLVFVFFVLLQGFDVSKERLAADPAAAAAVAAVPKSTPQTPERQSINQPPATGHTGEAAELRAAAVSSAATATTGIEAPSTEAAPAPSPANTEEVSPQALLATLKSCPASAARQASAGNIEPVAADLRPWALTEERIANVCRRRGLPRRVKGTEPKLIYAVMFGVEFDMLEVVLHEVAPVADTIFVTESTVTHSLGKKKLHFDSVKDARFAQFLPKVRHLVYSPVRAYKSGWDVEKRQRNHFLRYLRQQANVSEGDIVVGNIDLDEILARDTLVAMKYCDIDATTKPGDGVPFKLVHFRYSTNCIQEAKYNTYFDTAFRFSDSLGTKARPLDLYKRRLNRDSKPLASPPSTDMAAGVRRVIRDGGAWHLTAFGGIKAILHKYQNSPHRFVGSLSEADVVKVMHGCEYQDTRRWKLPFWTGPQNTTIGDSPWWLPNGADEGSGAWPPVPLPYALTQRPCQMLARGWFR